MPYQRRAAASLKPQTPKEKPDLRREARLTASAATL
jgi:hypothetical protein